MSRMAEQARPDEWTQEMRAAMARLEKEDAHQPATAWMDYLEILTARRFEGWRDDMTRAADAEMDPE